jgi:glutamate/aspartate transport system substrate-binding protein
MVDEARERSERRFLFVEIAMHRLILTVLAFVSVPYVVAAQPLEGRLKHISETKIVKIAHRSDAKPFSFQNPNGEPDGYTVELCKSVVRSFEQQLDAKLTIAWVPVDTQTRFDAVASGLADMECGSSTVSFSRLQKVDFSSFIFMENTGLIVRLDSGLQSVAEVGGKRIAVIAGTTNEAALARELQRRQLQAEIVRVRDRREGMAWIESGIVDSFASDKLLLIEAPNANASSYRMLPENLSMEPYAIALPRGDWAFRNAVNKGLSRTYGSGEILDIYLKWFAALGGRPDLLRAAVYIFGTLPE